MKKNNNRRRKPLPDRNICETVCYDLRRMGYAPYYVGGYPHTSNYQHTRLGGNR
jgi:hypothetical protein